MEDEMERAVRQAKDAVCQEADGIADMLLQWQLPVEDPEGYLFTRGYLQGLMRALALMKGDRLWNSEDVSDWYVLNVAGEPQRRSEGGCTLDWVVRSGKM